MQLPHTHTAIKRHYTHLSDNIKDTAKGLRSDRHLDRGAGVHASLSTDETLSGLHSNAADSVLSKVLGDLEDEAGLILGAVNLEGVKDLGEVSIVELDVDDGTNDLGDLSVAHKGGGGMEATGAGGCRYQDI